MFSSVLHKKLPAEAGVNVICVSPGIVQTNVVSIPNYIYYFNFLNWYLKKYIWCGNCMQARDLHKIVQAGYRLIPYFIFNAEEGK